MEEIPPSKAVTNVIQMSSLAEMRRAVHQMATLEAAPPGKLASPRTAARDIKKSPLFRDPAERRTANWLTRAFERLAMAIGELLRRLLGGMPAVAPPQGGAIGSWLTYTVWALLGVAVLAMVYFVARFFALRAAYRRRLGGLMDEVEPDRTADEWLERAEELQGAGREREAVRCLYLACLVRLDEFGVARFIRSQTNWEHLGRIEASPKRPAALDVRGPTKEFDRVWYGRRVRPTEDYEYFRAQYETLMQQVKAA
jgi:hypothetical protein